MAVTIKDITATAYTLLAGDDGLLLRFDNSADITVTCPDTLLQGFQCQFQQVGTGQVIFVADGSTTFVDTRIPKTRTKGSFGAITLDLNASYKFNGEFVISTALFLNNTSAASAPTAGDDDTAGYSVGSIWITTSGAIYDCIDNTSVAAVWKQRVHYNDAKLAPFITEPASPSSGCLIYVDVNDNDLKAKFNDGTVYTIVTTP